MLPDHLTVKEIAEIMRVGREQVRRWLQEGKLNGIKPYRDWLVSRDELERFKTEREKRINEE
jgi:excisionase family DNA binding protein